MMTKKIEYSKFVHVCPLKLDRGYVEYDLRFILRFFNAWLVDASVRL